MPKRPSPPRPPGIGKPPPLPSARRIGKPPALLPPLPDERPAADPLATVPVTGDPERDAAAELGAVEESFRQRLAEEKRRFRHATDVEYHFTAVFTDRRQRDAFLKAAGQEPARFIDGRQLAHQLGIALPAPIIGAPKEPSPDQRLADLVMKGDD